MQVTSRRHTATIPSGIFNIHTLMLIIAGLWFMVLANPLWLRLGPALAITGVLAIELWNMKPRVHHKVRLSYAAWLLARITSPFVAIGLVLADFDLANPGAAGPRALFAFVLIAWTMIAGHSTKWS